MSTTGCGSKFKKVYNESRNTSSYTGTISYSDLWHLDVIEIENINGDLEHYLMFYSNMFSNSSFDVDSGRTLFKWNTKKSVYGTCISTMNMKEFIIAELGLKDNYHLDDIRKVYNKIISNYDTLKEEEKVKKLIIKYN